MSGEKLFNLAEIIVIAAILFSGFVLFAYERENHNPDYQKDWVAFYFVDPNVPANGVVAENHTGKNINLHYCLVPDNDNLMEPGDLSCALNSALESSDKNTPEGSLQEWKYKMPEKNGKYWVVVEYKDGDILKSKNLSFEIK